MPPPVVALRAPRVRTGPLRAAVATGSVAVVVLALALVGGTAAGAAGPNLVVNGWFEQGTRGWTASSGAELTSVPAGRTGRGVRLTNTTSGPGPAELHDAVDTSPRRRPARSTRPARGCAHCRGRRRSPCA